MDSLKQNLKEGISLPPLDSICLNPDPDSCSGLISQRVELETNNVPALNKDHELEISQKFKESQRKICEKCIWVRKSSLVS